MRRKPTGSSSDAKNDGKGKARKGRRRKEDSSSFSSEVISLSKIDDSQKPIATMKVSLARKAILNSEISSSEQLAKKSSMNPNNGNPPTTTTQTSVVESKNVVDDIWSRLDNGVIDIKYATVGYGPNGRLILDHDILVTLLINYGYKIDDVLAFIDDFNSMSENDNYFPLVMMNSHVYDMNDWESL